MLSRVSGRYDSMKIRNYMDQAMIAVNNAQSSISTGRFKRTQSRVSDNKKYPRALFPG